MTCLDERENIMTDGEELTNQSAPSETPAQAEEQEKEPSQGEIEAREKMENIFKSVSQKKQETETTSMPEPEMAPAETEPESKQVEIELMTVQIPTTEEKQEEEQKRSKEREKRKKLMARKGFLVALISIAVIAGGFLYTDFMPKNITGEVVITIPEGAGTKQIANILEKDGMVHSKLFYRAMSKIFRVDGKYNFGKFKLDKGAGYKQIFEVLTQSGEVGNAIRVTIPEGYEIYKIADTLEEKGLIDKNKFYYLIDYGSFDYEFVNTIPQRENRLEGYLFPDTYSFVPGDEYGIINEMLKQFNKVYEKYKWRAEEMGMTMDQVVTLASIIEREALGEEDRKLVSSVFHNRLKSTDYPYLQSCATVQYVLRERKAVLSLEDTRIDSPYNTYINKGLPVGPIASPGEAAIEAALYPAESDYLFFVLGSDNKHHFSKTFDEHRQNKNN